MKFGYIIACWVGERRTATPAYSKDKLIYIKQQIKCLQKFRHSLDLVVFVFNQPDEPEDTAANHRQLIESAKNLILNSDLQADKVEIVVRPNTDYSYGAWHQALVDYGETVDYTLLTEDDYMPNAHDFDKAFQSYFTEKDVVYVCQLWQGPPPYPLHAAISNGMIKNSIFFDNLKDGDSFFFPGHDTCGTPNPPEAATPQSYAIGEQLQISFLQNYTDRGYKVKDIRENHGVVFREYRGLYVFYEVDEAKSIPLIPSYSEEDIHFRPMTEEDLPLVLETRNESTEYLHCNETFTIDEGIEWYRKTKPWYFIIGLEKMQFIGYFRTSNHSEEDKSIYIGADMHKAYRGLGLGVKAYRKFIPWLFDTLELNKILLEVLATNKRAIHIYEKLGFVQDEVKENAVTKDGEAVDSIVMSLHRNK